MRSHWYPASLSPIHRGTWTIDCLTCFWSEIHVRSIPWIERLFSDTALHLTPSGFRLLRDRIGRASTRFRCVDEPTFGRAAPDWAKARPVTMSRPHRSRADCAHSDADGSTISG